MFTLGTDGYPTRLSGSSQISTIRQNPNPAGLHVSRRIGSALITVSTLVRQSAAADISSSRRLSVWFAACGEWLAKYSNTLS